jgi:nitrogen regulatory protein P-II 1
MNKVEAIIRPERLDAVKEALAGAGFVGLNIVAVTGRGVQKGIVHAGRGGEEYRVDMLPKAKIELVVTDSETDKAVNTIIEAARTGAIGDGKIFVSPVTRAIRIRTNETGDAVLYRQRPHQRLSGGHLHGLAARLHLWPARSA